METIFGLHPKNASGEISVEGTARKIESPCDAIKAGIALVPEDRKLQGLILNQSVNKNISLTILDQLQNWGIMLNHAKEKALSAEFITRLGIKTSSGNNAAQNLSGGNQQKIVLAKWMATNPQILLLDEPTSGMSESEADSAIQAVRRLAEQFSMTLLVIEHNMDFVMDLCHRIMVMVEGQVMAIGTPEEIRANKQVLDAYLGN